MENASAVTSFILMAYAEMEDHRYLYFACFFLLYIVILFTNSVLIAVICIERGLHEPMYLFICNLAVNGVYGSTSLLPSMLVNLLSKNYEISLSCCLLQIYSLHSYGTIEFTMLAAMGYDRYIAICHPLHYHLIMHPRKVYVVIALTWVVPCIYFCLLFLFTVQRTFCDSYIEKVYCSNYPVVKLSCYDTSIQSIVGLSSLLISPSSQILIILFSYAQILRICLFTSKEPQTKAIQTCTPHLLAVINYAVGALFELIQSRFKMSHVPYTARTFMSVYFLIFTPLFNPLIYGISIQAIRVHILKLFRSRQNRLTKQKVIMK